MPLEDEQVGIFANWSVPRRSSSLYMRAASLVQRAQRIIAAIPCCTANNPISGKSGRRVLRIALHGNAQPRRLRSAAARTAGVRATATARAAVKPNLLLAGQQRLDRVRRFVRIEQHQRTFSSSTKNLQAALIWAAVCTSTTAGCALRTACETARDCRRASAAPGARLCPAACTCTLNSTRSVRAGRFKVRRIGQCDGARQVVSRSRVPLITAARRRIDIDFERHVVPIERAAQRGSSPLMGSVSRPSIEAPVSFIRASRTRVAAAARR